jgi:hypothetical protein
LLLLRLRRWCACYHALVVHRGARPQSSSGRFNTMTSSSSIGSPCPSRPGANESGPSRPNRG